MKTFRTFILATIVLSFIGCNNRTTTDTPNLDDTNRSVEDRTTTTATTDRMESTTPTGTDNTFSDSDRREMYRHLDMTQDQISQFERAENDGNQSASQINTQTDRDSRLKNILSAEQYRKYETWRDDRNRTNTTNMP